MTYGQDWRRFPIQWAPPERTIGPTLEPVTLDEARTSVRLGAGTAEPAPDALTAALPSPAIAGVVDNGDHRYRVTFVTADGETEGGTVSAAVTVADKAVNGKVALSAIPLGGSAVTSRKIYRTTAGGSTYLLLVTLADNTTTAYTDNIADAALGAGCPTVNTTADPHLTALITAARETLEETLSRSLLTQTWVLRLSRFPAWEIPLPRPPLVSVTSITYLDSNGVSQTVDPARYTVDPYAYVGRVVPAYGLYWPATRPVPNAVTVTYVAGWTTRGAVPQMIRRAILMVVGSLYENREADAEKALTRLAFYDSLVDTHRSRWEPEFA
jgi:uncharacterized phiE125 gp8 family phage protein